MGLTQFIITFLVLCSSVHSKDEPDLQCTVNQHKQVTCLWDQQGVPKENYTLKYWFDNKEDSAVLCPKYLLNESIHIGCWIQEPIETFTPFTALLISSNLEKTVQRKYNQPQNFVKLDPPNGLQVANTSSMELILKWDVSNSSYPNRCIEFQVQYKSSTDRIWTVKEASTFLFSLPSYDPEKMYTFHVRSKLSNSCSGAKTWSEWSVGVSWGRNTTIIAGQLEPNQTPDLKSLLIYLMSTFVLVVLVIIMIRVERIWVIFVPRIPNPGKNFEDLFSTHEGDFQKWLGVSKDVVESLKHNYSESLCTVTEDSDCNGGETKTLAPV